MTLSIIAKTQYPLLTFSAKPHPAILEDESGFLKPQMPSMKYIVTYECKWT